MTHTLRLFGLGTTSLGAFADAYRNHYKKLNNRRKKASKKKLALPVVTYVGDVFRNPGKADIYLVETIHNLIVHGNKFPSQSTVVVSDSPILLNEQEELVPLDWIKERSFEFIFKPVDIRLFEKMRTAKNGHEGKIIIPNNANRLGLVIDNTIEGRLLTPWNKLMMQLPYSHRGQLRTALSDLLNGKKNLDAFKKEVDAIIGSHATTLSNILLHQLMLVLKKYLKECVSFLALLRAKKNIKTPIEKSDLSLFEIKYFYKLVQGHNV